MSDPVVSLTGPSDIRRVGRFLGRRFRANRVARLKNWTLSEQFIQLHERKDHTDRFWIGEQVGKWLDAAVYAGLIVADEELLDRVNEILKRLARAKVGDGHLGVTARRLRNPVRAIPGTSVTYRESSTRCSVMYLFLFHSTIAYTTTHAPIVGRA